jgi:broad specificity phosphatase PhoE
MITAFGQTFETRKQLKFYALGLIDRGNRIIAQIDRWDGESDLAVTDTAVRINDDLDLPDLSAETIADAWKERVEALEQEQAERLVQAETAHAEQVAAHEARIKNLIREVLAESDGKGEDGRK